MLLLLIVIVIGVSIYLGINQANIKGKVGEKIVSSKLLSLPDEYYLFNDVYIEVEGRSVQIDHVIISQYGIFVIETKNYKGWIFGTDKAEYWVKNMYGKKYQFRNPLKQNYSHVKSLQTLLDISIDKLVPIVVFLRGATLKCNTTGNVVYYHQINNMILSYSTPIFTESEVQLLVKKLSSVYVVDKEKKKEHIYKVKHEINQKKAMLNSGVCPKCNGRLIERHGKYGRFIGCSNYPQCKYTIRL